MDLYPWLKLAHILSAMVWLGGGLMLLFAARRARSSVDPASIGGFAASLAYLGPRLLAPSVAGVLIFGVWMVLIDSAWDFGQLWVLLAIGLFAVAFLVGAVYLSRVGIQLAKAGGSVAEERALLDRWQIGYVIVLAILLVAAWDMVFKPGL